MRLSAQFALAPGASASVALASSANEEDNQAILPAPVLDGLGHFYLCASAVTFFADAGYHPVVILGGQYMLDNSSNGAQISVTNYLVTL